MLATSKQVCKAIRQAAKELDKHLGRTFVDTRWKKEDERAIAIQSSDWAFGSRGAGKRNDSVAARAMQILSSQGYNNVVTANYAYIRCATCKFV